MESYEQLYKQYEPMMYKLLQRLFIMKEREEYLQVAAIALWQASLTYEETKGAFPLYAYMKMKYAMIEWYRKQSSLGPIVYDDESILQLAHIQNVDDYIIVQDVMALLTEEERHIIISYYIEGLKDAQIARRLNCRADTVKKRRQRIIKRLKNRYKV